MKRHVLALAALTAVLLTACTGSQTPIKAPDHGLSPVGGVIAIESTGIGSAQPTASAGSLGKGLQAQGLVGVSDAFAFTHVSTDTFTRSGTRHVRTTFQVTNNTGQTLLNPTFLPVDTALTIGTTPFSAVKLYNDTDAPAAKADQLVLTQGKRFSAGNLEVTTDPEASVFVSGLDVSGVTPANVTTVFNSGWRVDTTWQPGATKNVTFAVDMPMEASSANDPFKITLLVTGAQDSGGTNLRSAVQQLDRTTNTYANYSKFPVSGGHSLAAYYDVQTTANAPAVLCSTDANVSITNINSVAFPNRYRVEMTATGPATLNAFFGTSCPASGPPAATQAITGVGPGGKTMDASSSAGWTMVALNDGTVRL